LDGHGVRYDRAAGLLVAEPDRWCPRALRDRLSAVPDSTPSEGAYYAPEVANLLVSLEEATRATPEGGPNVFVPPAGGELSQAQANFHHFVFGRRGSGKTTLLRRIQRQLKDEGRATVWIDQELFMELSFPDVLVSSVLAVMDGVRRAIKESAARQPESSGIRDFFKNRSSRHLKAERTAEIIERLDQVINNLSVVKFAPSDRKIEWTHKTGSANTTEVLGSVKLGHPGVAGVEGGANESAIISSEATSAETIESSKEEYLERSLTDFRAILVDASNEVGGGYVFLDEFYRVNRNDQPLVLGYMHRLVKDTGFWLKVGSVRYWTTPYRGGNPPRGMQETQDAGVISLDRGLQFVESTGKFLEEILTNIAKPSRTDVSALMTPGALKRLVLASGGVPRDYLRLAAQAIHQARNRGPSAKGGSQRVMAEDVNQAAGQTGPAKLNDLREDAPDEAATLEALLADLTEFCRARKTAYFLVDNQDAELTSKIDQLQDLRFTHMLFESETIPDEGSRRHKVLLLDVSHLSAQRALEVDFEGWQERSKRRRKRLIYHEGEGAARVTAPIAKADPMPEASSETMPLFERED
jgi:energy-coupling factor transporter ATP-binding protein EcfA2